MMIHPTISHSDTAMTPLSEAIDRLAAEAQKELGSHKRGFDIIRSAVLSGITEALGREPSEAVLKCMTEFDGDLYFVRRKKVWEAMSAALVAELKETKL